MNKFQFAALVIAIVIGFAVGNVVTSTIKTKQILSIREQYEKRIEQDIKNSLEQIKERDQLIDSLLDINEKKDILVLNLKSDIERGRTKTEVKREEAKQLNDVEKLNWILSRYSTTPH